MHGCMDAYSLSVLEVLKVGRRHIFQPCQNALVASPWGQPPDGDKSPATLVFIHQATETHGRTQWGPEDPEQYAEESGICSVLSGGGLAGGGPL